MTIKDIARQAGVSPSTVSRVLSGSARISEETASRVRAIMAEVGYQPNLLARSLVRRTSNIVAVVLPFGSEETFEDPFNYDVLRGICASAQTAGKSVLLYTGFEEDASVAPLSQGGVVAGAILLTSRVDDPACALLMETGLPFVVLGHPSLDTQINWVDNDNVQAARDAAEYLIAHGHQRIAFLGYEPHYTATKDRLKGFEQALAHHRLKVNPQHIIQAPFSARPPDDEAILRPFTRPGRPTAAVVSSGYLALHFLELARQSGFSVPKDISLVSFNNVWGSQSTQPPLTTLELNPRALGKRLVEVLLSSLNDPGGGVSRALVPHRLIERESVAVPSL